MNLQTIQLKRHKEESLKRFHPWIFSGAIEHLPENIQNGDIVQVITHDGDFIAKGHYQIGSIAVRVLTFENEEINESFWEKRINAAYLVRQAIGLANHSNNDTYRLVHGEGDNLP